MYDTSIFLIRIFLLKHSFGPGRPGKAPSFKIQAVNLLGELGKNAEGDGWCALREGALYLEIYFATTNIVANESNFLKWATKKGPIDFQDLFRFFQQLKTL